MATQRAANRESNIRPRARTVTALPATGAMGAALTEATGSPNASADLFIRAGDTSPGFTLVTVTGSYGTSAAGTVTFTLTQPMANADAILLPDPIVVTLAASAFSQALAANDDTATIPQGVLWAVTENIDGSQPRDYFITVPSALTTIDISTLMPGQIGWT